MATKAQSRASAKYDKAHTKGVYLKLDLEIDIRAARFKLLAFNSVLIALVFFDFDFVKYRLTFNN